MRSEIGGVSESPSGASTPLENVAWYDVMKRTHAKAKRRGGRRTNVCMRKRWCQDGACLKIILLIRKTHPRF